MELSLKTLSLYAISLLEKAGVSSPLSSYIGEISVLILLILFSYLAYRLAWYLFKRIFIPIMQRSKNQFDDILLKHVFFKKISFLVPALLLYYFAEGALFDLPLLVNLIKTLLNISFVLIAVLIIDSLLSTVNDYYNRFEISKDHPIQSLIQITKIIIYLVALLFVIGTLMHRDLSSLFISLGTLSAVLMLVFKDPILGFVGGLQLIFNKMIRIGDWVSVPKHHADGVVTEITLTTVKIQNWDKTITTLPTYSLISDSFQNWRGMEESGGRRIKRSVNIDMDSIHFVREEELEQFRKIKVLKPYLDKKEKEIETYNKKFKVDPDILINGRRQTNLGIFRAYLKVYLHNRNDLHSDMTFLVRQLQPSEKGIPIEIYVFTKTTAWAEYEDIQADIFDHILAVIPEFNLKIYQYPKSGDVSRFIQES